MRNAENSEKHNAMQPTKSVPNSSTLQ
jgi:hypothetical protein